MKNFEAQIKKLEDKIGEEYRKCPDEIKCDQEKEFKWWQTTIEPLDEKITELKKEKYKQELLNVKVGDGVTIGCWTDRYAYTVISRTAKTITIQRDRAIRTDMNGMSECQEYKYERDSNGDIKVFRWSDKKGWIYSCYKLGLGRFEYFDFSF